MSLLEKTCEHLGVEVGEEWKNNVGDTYKITEKGLFYKCTATDWEECGSLGYNKLLTGELKPKWEPKEGELYYLPSIKKLKDHRFHESAWLNDDIDNWYMTNNMVFKTKEEAIDCATNMIDLAKHRV